MRKFGFAILVYFLLSSCSNESVIVNNNSGTDSMSKILNSADTSLIDKTVSVRIPADSFVLKEIDAMEDLPANEYLKERLQPIRDNFKRINSITNWQSIVKIDFWESTEGGFAVYYTDNVGLEKIVSREFGETYQQLTEFYLWQNRLSFVFRKMYNYNRPIYYDSLSMIKNKDDQYFDFNESETIEDRYYFEKGKLIHMINSQDCGSPFPDDLLAKEETAIKKQYSLLINLSKK